MNSIPLQDLTAQYNALRSEIDAAVQRVLESGWYILGAETKAFEEEFAAWNGAAGCVGVNSGTDALHLALWACDVGPGDEVVTVSHTAVATVAAICATGATPVLADVDPVTYTISPKSLAASVTLSTKAIVPVHLYGQSADMTAVRSIADDIGAWVIEDCAQAHGARYTDRRVGTIGDLGCFSFYPTKNLGAVGDGGAIITDNTELKDRIRRLRQYGWTPASRYVSQEEGINSRLDEMQAAILRTKLSHLDDWNRRRQSLAAAYDRLLPESVIRPVTAPNCEHVYHLYVVRTSDRDGLMAHLRQAGIGTAIHYPVPVHHMPAYRSVVRMPAELPHTERLVDEIVSLPMHPMLTETDIEHVASTITAYFA